MAYKTEHEALVEIAKITSLDKADFKKQVYALDKQTLAYALAAMWFGRFVMENRSSIYPELYRAEAANLDDDYYRDNCYGDETEEENQTIDLYNEWKMQVKSANRQVKNDTGISGYILDKAEIVRFFQITLAVKRISFLDLLDSNITFFDSRD